MRKKQMPKTKRINNTFLDLVCLLLSFFMSFFRSVVLLFKKQKVSGYRNYFFDLLDFIFRLWPAYFWKKPT